MFSPGVESPRQASLAGDGTGVNEIKRQSPVGAAHKCSTSAVNIDAVSWHAEMVCR
jgi:hypothetical protein